MPAAPCLPPSLSTVDGENYAPDFSALQHYKCGFKDHYWGIDIEYAWSLGIAGQGVRIADIEWSFIFDHLNLKRETFVELIPLSVNSYHDHGAAIVGILYAKNDDCGVTGMVHQADIFYGVSEYTNGKITRPSNIAIALE